MHGWRIGVNAFDVHLSLFIASCIARLWGVRKNINTSVVILGFVITSEYAKKLWKQVVCCRVAFKLSTVSVFSHLTPQLHRNMNRDRK